MSCLNITMEERNGRTAMSQCYFTQPFKVTKPFEYTDTTQIMIMTATAGIMKGDYYDIKVNAGANTSTLITNQSYSKVFDTMDGFASQSQHIELEKGAEFAWFMKPMILFGNSNFQSDTQIYLGEQTSLFYVDILAGGRIGMGERFAFYKYHGRTLIYNSEGKPIFLDNVLLEPEKGEIQGLGYFEESTHIGLIYLYGYQEPVLPFAEGVEAVMSKAQEGYVVRIMGSSGDRLYEYAEQLYRDRSRH